MEATGDSSLVADDEPGARAKARSPTAKSSGNNAVNGNDEAKEAEKEGVEQPQEEEALGLMNSDMSDTDSEGFVRSDHLGGSRNASQDEETKEAEEPIELELCDDSEDESRSEVELVLVGDELVELDRTGVVHASNLPASDVHAEEDEGKPTRRGTPYSEIDVAADEKLMRAVVACESEFADTSLRKMVVWEAIATHCGGGRFANGSAAKGRVTWLQRVHANASHRVHGDLSEELQRLIAQFEATRAQCRQAVPVYRSPPTLTADEQTRVVERIVEQLNQRTIQHDTSEVGNRKGSEASEDDDGESPLPCIPDSPGRQVDVDAALEAKVMRVVLRHAPKLAYADGKDKDAVWDEIAADSRGRYTNGETARVRTHWLCKLLKQVSHQQHASISPTLRSMLRQYLRVVSTRTEVVEDADEQFMKLVVKMRPFARSSQTNTWSEIATLAENPRIRGWISGRARVQFLLDVFKNPNHDQHAKLSPGLRSSIEEFLEMRAQDDHGIMAAPVESSNESDSSIDDSEFEDDHKNEATGGATAASENSALLREILRTCPFQVPNDRMRVWSEVAAAVRAEFGSKCSLETGQQCLMRMKRLLRVVRNPQKLQESGLSVYQVEMLKLIDRLLKTPWPQRESNFTTAHRQLQREMAAFVDTPQPQRTLQDASETVLDSQASDSVPPIPLIQGEEDNASGNKRDRGQHIDIEEPPQRSNKRKRSVLDEPAHVPMDGPPPKLCHPQADEIQALHTEVAMCRAQMTIQSSSFENERREHRTDLRATLEMLKLEREANNRETTALVGLLKQEQEDRKHQFVALMNLVTRSIPQQS